VPNRTAPEDPFSTFAAEMSTNLSLITRLLAEHPAEGERCPGCPVPPGRPPITTPCSVRSLAIMALKIRAEREDVR
jgi:hypothetical protein